MSSCKPKSRVERAKASRMAVLLVNCTFTDFMASIYDYLNKKPRSSKSITAARLIIVRAVCSTIYTSAARKLLRSTAEKLLM